MDSDKTRQIRGQLVRQKRYLSNIHVKPAELQSASAQAHRRKRKCCHIL